MKRLFSQPFTNYNLSTRIFIAPSNSDPISERYTRQCLVQNFHLKAWKRHATWNENQIFPDRLRERERETSDLFIRTPPYECNLGSRTRFFRSNRSGNIGSRPAVIIKERKVKCCEYNACFSLCVKTISNLTLSFRGKTDYDRVCWNEWEVFCLENKFFRDNCNALSSFRFINNLKVMEGFWIESLLLDRQCYLCESRKIKNTFTTNSNFNFYDISYYCPT